MERNRQAERKQQSKEMKADHQDNHIANVNILRGVYWHGKYFSEDRLPRKNDYSSKEYGS